MLPRPVQNLIDQLAKLPSVGPRQAARFVFYLLKQPEKEIRNLYQALLDLKNIDHCTLCFRTIEKIKNKTSSLCAICKSQNRDKSIICIVEKDVDLEAIENTKKYNGLYHVLGTSEFDSLDKNFIKQLHLDKLIGRVRKNKDIKEIIIATSATTEGDTLALYIDRILSKNLPNIKITRLGRGLSTGSELEYMDEDTIAQALLGRK